MLTIIAGCGAQSKANKFNDYFGQVSKNMEALKKSTDEFSNIADNANKLEDLKGIEKKIDGEKFLLNIVIGDYKNTIEPKELSSYKASVQQNLNKKMEQLNVLSDIINDINKNEINNPALKDKLNKLQALEKETNDKEIANAQLLNKIAKDNNLILKTKKDKTIFEVAK